jgi:hypothetical protein
LGINIELFEGSKGSSLIGFRGALFFWAIKRKEKGRVKTKYRNEVQSFLSLFFITLTLDYFIL